MMNSIILSTLLNFPFSFSSHKWMDVHRTNKACKHINKFSPHYKLFWKIQNVYRNKDFPNCSSTNLQKWLHKKLWNMIWKYIIPKAMTILYQFPNPLFEPYQFKIQKKSLWHNTDECRTKQSLVAEMKSSELDPDSNSDSEMDKGSRSSTQNLVLSLLPPRSNHKTQRSWRKVSAFFTHRCGWMVFRYISLLIMEAKRT